MAEVMDSIIGRIERTSYARFSPQIVGYTKMLCLSQLAALVGGVHMEASQIVARRARAQGGTQEAAVVGHGFSAPVTAAALCNATFAHATELEDDDLIDRLTIGTIIPAMFSLGQALRSCGKDVLESIVVGYDIQAKSCLAAGGPSKHGYMGFTTGAWGPAAGAAKLMKLKTGEVGMTMGIAASLLDGAHRQVPSMCHFLESGLGASNGILAAQLAQDGFTANPDIIETPHGLWDMMGADRQGLEELNRLLPDELRIMRVGIKRYGCAYIMQRVIDAALDLCREKGLSNDQVAFVDLHVAPWFTDWVNHPDPRNPDEARFSIHHTLAGVLLGDGVDLHTFTDATIQDAGYVAARRKIRVFVDEARGHTFFDRPDDMVITLKDGAVHRTSCEISKGTPPAYLTEEEVFDKFRSCARYSGYLDDAAVERVGAMVLDLENVADVSEIMTALC